MKKVLTALALTLFTSSALADWSINPHGVPIVYEQSSNKKALALLICMPEPTMALMDAAIPDSAIGQRLSFKARIDKKEIHEVVSEVVNLHTEVQGVYVRMTTDVLLDMYNGKAIRFQFSTNNGGKVVETYSLMGFTKVAEEAIKNCNKSNGDDFFNESEPQYKDSDYF